VRSAAPEPTSEGSVGLRNHQRAAPENRLPRRPEETTLTTESTSATDRQKVWELIKDIKIALMVTGNRGGRLHGRPMAAMNKEFDGDLWFASRDDAPKLDEIEDNTNVLLAYSEPKTQNYVSVSGTARIVRDPATVRTLWSEPMRVWFPKGPDDPQIALIRVSVESAEYWDAPSSTFVYAFGYAKARLTGEPPKNLGENKVVHF
jgi:general stress protein 26